MKGNKSLFKNFCSLVLLQLPSVWPSEHGHLRCLWDIHGRIRNNYEYRSGAWAGKITWKSSIYRWNNLGKEYRAREKSLGLSLEEVKNLGMWRSHSRFSPEREKSSIHMYGTQCPGSEEECFKKEQFQMLLRGQAKWILKKYHCI